MFCYQCEQTAMGKGCTKIGVCAKSPEVSALQDLLIHALKSMSIYADLARKNGLVKPDVNAFTVEALFSTLTNVDFDPARFVYFIKKAYALKEALKEELKQKNISLPDTAVFSEDSIFNFVPADTEEKMIEQGKKLEKTLPPAGVFSDVDVLKDLVLFGLKGIAAYLYHAHVLGKEDDSVYAFVHSALSAMAIASTAAGGEIAGTDFWLDMAMKTGAANLKAMELLDSANTGNYGHPVPTKVPLGHKKGKAILVSGHDLKDMEELLKQTEGKGIYVYTHGEMLPCHGYPGLKKYPHFFGHYGTAWQNQQKEFASFPGPILMTTNCLMKPLDSYKDRIFTAGVVGWPGVNHISGKDFTPLIEKALRMPGFTDDKEEKYVMTGFARNAVLSVADKVINAVKEKKIRHFFLVGGCDGAKPGRNYYTQFVEMVPKDCVVLTLACGKFRFFDKEMGDIDGIPRLLDVGQCNDAYSAIQIALALAKAFNVGVNELPLSLILSWYEQKAVAILLTLLSLGIKNIRLGPSLPAFITPNILDYLVKQYNIKPITTPEQDLKEILGG